MSTSNVRVSPLRGTAEAMTRHNVVLLAGEVGYEADTGNTKRGDGVTAWSALPYEVSSAMVADAITAQATLSIKAVADAIAAQAASDAATYSTLAQLAASPDLLAVGTITRSATGAATSFSVVWPDGATGTFTGTESTAAAGAIDSYTLTHAKNGTTITYTQPALTRDSTGAVTNRPAITVA